MRDRAFDLVVLGAGPAGILCALRGAERGHVALVADRLPEEDDPPRLDAVPARLLTLLVEFGLDPRAFQVDRLHRHRWVAWDRKTPQVVRLAPTAHVERPLLDRVLLSHALRHSRVTLFVSRQWACADGEFRGDGWQAPRLVDATGRAAATAETVIRCPRPWAARTLWRTCEPDGRGPPFALAPLPDGYAYRIETCRAVSVGFVGRGCAVEGVPADLACGLRASGGGWLVDDLPPLAAFDEGRPSTASVQWAVASAAGDASHPVRIGDAALARDPLSSQGIALACSEALFAASIEGETALEAFALRQIEQRQAHLAAMRTMIAHCRFSAEPTWRQYADFISRHAPTSSPPPAAALRGGTVVRLPPVSSPPDR